MNAVTRTPVHKQLEAAVRLELGEVRRSRWLQLATVVYVALSASLVFVGMRESAVLGFTGMNRVLLSFTHALIVLLPLFALAASSQVIARARDDGTMELLFSHPLSRRAYLIAFSVTRFSALCLPLVLVLAAMALAARSFGEAIPWSMLARTASVGAALLWAFIGLGTAVAVRTRDSAKAVVHGLVLWALCVALLDLALVGAMLRWPLPPRAVLTLAALNPVQAARLALLSGVERDLSTLGPVGVYAAEALGSRGLFALGLAWPLAVGAAAWAWALATFRRGDVV